jgi:hypothetical protein
MVPVANVGNISGEATTPSGNILNEAMRGTGRPPIHGSVRIIEQKAEVMLASRTAAQRP